ncbi:Apoptotic protease-activating factor 1, partial [Stegodyphus mimosarum]
MSTSDCHVVIFDVSNYSRQQPLEIYFAPKFYITCCDLSADKKFLACGTALGYVFILDVKSKNIAAEFLVQEDSFEIKNVIFSKDGKKLFCSTSSAVTIHLIPDESWLFTRQKLYTQFNGRKFITTVNHPNCIEVITNLNAELKWKSPEIKDITAISISSNLTEVVCGTKDGIVKVFIISNKVHSVINELERHHSAVNYITHSKNGLIFFTCSDDRTVRVWKNRESPLILEGHSDSVVMCVPFITRDHLLSCCKDGTLRVWDIRSRTTIFVLNHNNSREEAICKIMCCDVSADENILVSVSLNVKIWCAKKGELLKEIPMSLMCCKFSPFLLKYIPEEISGDLLVCDIQHE